VKNRLSTILIPTLITLTLSQPQAAALDSATPISSISDAARLYMEAVPLPTDSLKRVELLNKAEGILTKIIEGDPKSLEAYRKLLGVYLLKQDYTNSIRTVQEAITLSPNDPKLFITLAFLYEHSGEFEYAKAMLDEALNIAPDNKVAKDYKVVLEKKLKALLQSAKQATSAHSGADMSAHPLPSNSH